MLLFAVALFLSSSLLFLVQPLFARMVLPLLGGTPAVWNSCMVFFQAALLAGYAYSHILSSKIRPRAAAAIHCGLLLLALVALPLAIPSGWTPPAVSNPVPALLGLLLLSVGLPFFVVSTTAPLLQSWFARTGHPAARDPYFLYASSNFGSVVGLIGYLVLLEPHLTIREQSHLWTAAYGALIVLVATCALVSLRTPRPATGEAGDEDREAGAAVLLEPRRALRWVALAFVPSSLMLGVTTYITTDIAAVPLFWVIPLLLYLFSFMLVFSRRQLAPHNLFLRLLPILVLVQVVVLDKATMAMPSMPLLHLLTFFTACMVCHGELARDRPHPRLLTIYYLLLSLGGCLGGAFNALLAPVLFNSLLEYPVTLVLACTLCPRAWMARLRSQPDWRERLRFRRSDIVFPLLLAAVGAVLLYTLNRGYWDLGHRGHTLLYGGLAFVCYIFVERPARFVLGLWCLLVLITVEPGSSMPPSYQVRSFYGVHRVADYPDRPWRRLLHGSTLHGIQDLEPARRAEPLTYYYRTSPVGQVFAKLGPARTAKVAVVGLGAGTLACYAARGQQFTFYEIDPEVERIANNPRQFTYLADSRTRGADVPVVLGDARLTLTAAAVARYNLIVLDAFSSDSIATHLLTREALQLYLSRLEPGGIVAFHISNRCLKLEPVLAAVARDLKLAGLTQNDGATDEEREKGKWASEWVVLARSPADLAPLARDSRWVPLRARKGDRAWTDDYSNILSVLVWER